MATCRYTFCSDSTKDNAETCNAKASSAASYFTISPDSRSRLSLEIDDFFNSSLIAEKSRIEATHVHPELRATCIDHALRLRCKNSCDESNWRVYNPPIASALSFEVSLVTLSWSRESDNAAWICLELHLISPNLMWISMAQSVTGIDCKSFRRTLSRNTALAPRDWAE